MTELGQMFFDRMNKEYDLKLARRMLRFGEPIDKILDYTGLTECEILRLKEKIDEESAISETPS